MIAVQKSCIHASAVAVFVEWWIVVFVDNVSSQTCLMHNHTSNPPYDTTHLCERAAVHPLDICNSGSGYKIEFAEGPK